MRFTNLSLFALLAIFSVAVNAQEPGDDNVVPRPGDDRVVQPPVVPPVQPPVVPGQEPGDDNVIPRPGDDRGTNTTTTTTTPSPTAVPTNAAMKNSIGSLGLASLFAYFML
jgi:hypothetical protein